MAPQENAVAAAAAPEAKSSEGAPQTEKKDEAGTQVAAAAETKPAETAASDTKTSDNKSPSPAEATKTGSNGQDCEDDGQKMVDRAKRFGLKIPEVEDEKKLDRAKRFGLPVPELDAEKKQAISQAEAVLFQCLAARSAHGKHPERSFSIQSKAEPCPNLLGVQSGPWQAIWVLEAQRFTAKLAQWDQAPRCEATTAQCSALLRLTRMAGDDLSRRRAGLRKAKRKIKLRICCGSD